VGIAVTKHVWIESILHTPEIYTMKNTNHTTKPEQLFLTAEETTFDGQLLAIYWEKKDLDAFLPQIASYATPKELLNITLSQLSKMEKRIIWLLEAMALKTKKLANDLS